MSGDAELLRRAAALMREDAELAHTWSGPWRREAALAAADWLADEGSGVAVNPRAVALARAYLGET